jgi:hypothetical protein
MRLEKKIEEVTKVVEEFLKIREIECGGDVKCLMRKLVIVKEFYRVIDSLLHGMAFAYIQDISRIEIEKLVEKLIEAGIIKPHDWERAVAHEIAYIRRLNADRSSALKMPVPVPKEREDEEVESSR